MFETSSAHAWIFDWYLKIIFKFVFQLAQPPISDFERNMHTKIRNKMRSIGLPLSKSRGALLVELAHEMKLLKEELDECKSLLLLI